MIRFELRTSGVASDRSTNWATATALTYKFLSKQFCCKADDLLFD